MYLVKTGLACSIGMCWLTVGLLLGEPGSNFVHVSQQSTFLYSPRTRIQSSRPDAWSVQDVIQVGRSVRPPSPGKVIAHLRMWVDTSSYAGACIVRPSKKAL